MVLDLVLRCFVSVFGSFVIRMWWVFGRFFGSCGSCFVSGYGLIFVLRSRLWRCWCKSSCLLFCLRWFGFGGFVVVWMCVLLVEWWNCGWLGLGVLCRLGL